MRAPLVALALAAGGAVAALVAGVLLGRDVEESAPVFRPAATTAAVEAPPRAPALTGLDLDGKELSLAGLAGKPVVLHVWASWCAACAEEAPEIARFEAGHPRAVVLGIAYEDSAEDARRFAERRGWRHPILLDPDGRLSARLALLDLPTTLFLSPEHRIVSRVTGPVDLGTLEEHWAAARRAA